MSKTVKRRIQFFRCWAHESNGESRPLDTFPICNQIDRLLETSERYLEMGDGEAVCVWPMMAASQSRLCLGKIRRRALPLVEAHGKTYPLNLPPEQGLVERTHVVFFSDGVAGVEYNQYAPRLPKLGEYLKDKFPDLPVVTFEAILNPDISRQLEHLHDITLFEIRWRRSPEAFDEYSQQSPLAAIRSVGAEFDASTADLVLKANSRAGERLRSGIKELARALLRRPLLKQEVAALKIAGTDDRNGRREALDLLSAQLASTQEIVRIDDRYRAVDSEAMFEAIVAAYNQVYEILQAGATVSV